MYKDLSLKEKAKVIREGVRLGLTSINDILNLYDEAIGHKFAEGSITNPDWDPNNPYHYHTASGEKVVITPEDWEKHKGLPYFKLVEDAVLAEQAAHPGPEYIINPQFSEDLRRVYKGNMGPLYQNYSSFSGNLPEGYSFTPEGLISDSQGNLYVQKGFRQTPRFTYNESNPLVFPVLEGRNQGSVTFYPVNMDKTIKPALPVNSTMNVNKERDKAISEYIKDNTTHSTVNGTMYKEPYFYPNIDAVDYDWEEWKKEHPVQELRRAITKDYLYDLIKLKALNHFIFADEEGLEYDPFYFGEDNLEYFDLLFNNYINKPINQIKTTDNITKKPTYAKAKQKAVIKVGPLLVDGVLTYAQGGPIISPYGQWLFNGKKKKEDTIIPSNNITMDYVDYPVLGVSDTGDTKVMMPWNDYKFRGSMVYEHPLQEGGNTKPTFDLWYPMVPKQKNDTSSYDLRRAYNTLPFDELEKFRTINDYHLPSVAYDEKTDTYTFLKRNGHPTLNYELDWYNSGRPDALEFRERYKLDTLNLPWRYVPITYLNGGGLYLERIKPIEEYITPLEPMVLDNTYVVRNYPYYLLPEIQNKKKRLSDEEISNYYGSNIVWTMENPKHKGLNPDGTYSAYEDEAGFNFGPGLHAKSNNLDINKTYTKLELDSIASNIALNYMKLISEDLETMLDGKYAGARDTLSAGPLLTMLDIAYNVKPKNKGNMPQKWPNLTDSLINGNIEKAKENTYSGSTRRQKMRNQMIVYKPLEGITVHNEALGGNLFKKGGIYIKPENRGKFTALKKRTGHSASWFKAHGTPALRKMATFALNSKHWNHKHDEGGYLYSEGGFLLAPYLYNE